MITVTVIINNKETKLNLDEMRLYDRYQQEFPEVDMPSDDDVVQYYIDENYPDATEFWIDYA